MANTQRKRLVVCFDGTWNSADRGGSDTNVARIARAVRGSSGDLPQLTLYLRGVGSTGNAARRLLDGAIGEGVDDNILSAYMFLAQNYLPADPDEGRDQPDDIFLFGFSRGAFTARSLTGLIGACGLLKRQQLDHVRTAWEFYRTEQKPNRKPDRFAAKHGIDTHQDAAVSFLGVWDTVGALGIPSSLIGSLFDEEYEFHDTSPSRIVKVARHALAIDEHRDEFVPTFWTGTAPAGADIRQVWFAGVHSDVGGGYRNHALADIPLRWMADEAMAAGLQLDDAVLPQKIEALDPLAPQHESRRRLSRKDFFTPTFRRIEERRIDASFNEGVYVPKDAAGEVLRTINESIHPSALRRLGKEVKVLVGDEEDGETVTYRPKNLASSGKKAR